MQHGYAKLARGPDDFQACDPVEPCRGLPAMKRGGWRSILRAGRSDSDGNGLECETKARGGAVQRMVSSRLRSGTASTSPPREAPLR